MRPADPFKLGAMPAPHDLPVPDYSQPAERTPSLLLTEKQITFYHQHGYLAIDAIMPAAEIPVLRELYDHLFDPSHPLANMGKHDLAGTGDLTAKAALPQILQPAKFEPALLATQLVANIKAMMRQLHGIETKMVGDHAINKPPHNGAATPWHQDEAYWNPAVDYSSLSVWVPLQPATLQNGCMHFVPQSHRLEVIPHRPIGDNPHTPGLEVAPGAYDFQNAVACELPAGGATFHSGRTLHYTPPNNSDDFRRAYIAMGSASETPREVPRAFPWQQRQAAARGQV
jgi:ectoine hydroxylase-related dioxygenase (phytanoyl-CoA dioxygenase family)